VSPLSLASLTFACAFGGALLGSYVRSFLPPTHLAKESLDVMRLGMGLVATMTALLLGLVTASARSTFDGQDAALRASAANILTLDRLLARYGPETKPTRELIRQAVEYRIQTTWPDDGSRGSGLSKPVPAPAIEEIEHQILELTPTTDAQRWYKSESLKLSEEVMKTRWRILGAQSGTVPIVFLIVVIAWLTVTFASFGLYTQPNASLIAILILAALSVAAAVFLILELDAPFDGFITISGEPFRFALANLGQ
jgi:hypothetical protein